MSTSNDPLSFLMEADSSSNSSDPLSFLKDSKIQSKDNPTLGQKVARKAIQPVIGAAEYVTAPWNFANALEREGAHKSRTRVSTQAQKDLERMDDKLAKGEPLTRLEKIHYEKTKQLAQRKSEKASSADVGTLLEKGIEGATGINVEPQTLDEHGVRILSSLRNPSKWGKTITNIPKRFTQVGRQAIKLEKNAIQMKSLEKIAKGNPEKEGILNLAKERGLSPQATSLLLRSKESGELLGRLGKKTGKYKEVVEEIRSKLGENYDQLKKIGREGGYLGSNETTKLTDSLRKMSNELERPHIKNEDMKSGIKAIDEAIFKIETEGAGTIGDLVTTRQSIPQNIDPQGRVYNQLREVYMKAIDNTNPRVAQRLKIADQSYEKLLSHEKILEKVPKTVKIKGIELPVTDTIYGSALGAASKVLTGVGVPVAIGYPIAKQVAQRMFTNFLINPKYQGLHKKLINATLKGDKEQTVRLITTAYRLMKEDDPEFDSKSPLPKESQE